MSEPRGKWNSGRILESSFENDPTVSLPVPILTDFLWLFLGLTLLYVGGEWLVRGSREISLKVGISPLVVGLTVVAFGTSAPELLVSLQANLQDPPKGDMALGNVVGSNICNIALILGVGAMIRPMAVHAQVLKREVPFLLIISVIFACLLLDGSIAQLEGVVLFVGVVTYTIISLRHARKDGEISALESTTEDSGQGPATTRAGGMFLDIGFVVLGIGALVYGADRLILGGSSIAGRFGVPEATIALTIVAFGTSLPELATSIVAAIRRQGDLIIGNAVGSCIFNILCVVGLTAAISPLARTHDLRNLDLWVMLGLTAILLPLLWSRRTLSRKEGGALLTAYACYVCYLAMR